MPLPIYKPLGATPLEVINNLKKQRPELAEETISYAGRLDPMAEGLLLLLVGEENKKRKKFESLEKTYEFDVVFGIATDSYDFLGIPELAEKIPSLNEIKAKLPDVLSTFIGMITQAYPPYSSKPVNGKPLYFWARKNQLDSITLPTHEVTITSLEATQYTTTPLPDLANSAIRKISLVHGDFRQEECIEAWKQLEKVTVPPLSTVSLEITCSSGMYIRQLAYDLGRECNTNAFANRILRTRVGEYTLD